MKTQADIQKLKDLLTDIDTAMLSTLNGDEIKSRPMATIDIDTEGNIWFFTDEFSEKVEELENTSRVSLAYVHPGKERYVAINAEAAIVNDKQKMQELFNADVKRYFPKGLEDPRLALLKVSPYHVEYWESHENDMLHFTGILGFSDEAYRELHHGSHGTLNL